MLPPPLEVLPAVDVVVVAADADPVAAPVPVPVPPPLPPFEAVFAVGSEPAFDEDAITG